MRQLAYYALCFDDVDDPPVDNTLPQVRSMAAAAAVAAAAAAATAAAAAPCEAVHLALAWLAVRPTSGAHMVYTQARQTHMLSPPCPLASLLPVGTPLLPLPALPSPCPLSQAALGNTLRSYIPNVSGAWLFQKFAIMEYPATVAAALNIPGNCRQWH